MEADIPISVLPGPSALLSALIVSGIPPEPFVFLGFLPRKSGKRQKLLAAYQERLEALLCFESPHRLIQSLTDILSVLGDRKMAVCRELSKKFEDIQRNTVSALLAHFQAHPPRGEITLVIEGTPYPKGSSPLT
jgi:16S rRNA (cytidine1402-2'-O)-methyltransferase